MSEKNRIEESFMALSNLIAEPVIIINGTGKVLAANNFIKEITGYGSRDMIGKDFLQLEFLDQENKALFVKNFEKRMKGIEIEPYEIKISSKNGESRYFEVKGKKINYANEQVDLVVCHDVTQRINIQEKLRVSLDDRTTSLRESEERLRSIFESSPDAITLFDLNGTIIDCNKSTLNLHGFSSKEELIGKSAFQLISPKDNERAALLLKELLDVGKIQPLEFTFLTKDGKQFPGEGAGAILRDSSGQPKAFVAITRNIASRHRMQQALKDSEKKYHKLFEEAIDAIFLADAETGIIIDCNKAALKLVGWEKPELIGKHLCMIQAKEELDGEFTKWFRKPLQEEGETVETKIITKKGEVKDVAIKANFLKIDGKRLLQGIFRDITHRKKSERELINLSRFPFENPNSVLRIAKDGTVLYANPAAKLQLSELKLEIGQLAPPQLSQLVADSLSSGLKKEVEFKYRDRLFMLTLAPVADNAYVNVYGLDITNRKKTEEALYTSEEKYRMLFEGATDAIMIADAETGIIVDCNAAALRMFGKEKSELVGQHQSSVHPKELMTSGFTKGFREHLHDPTIIRETQITTKKGDIRDVTIRPSLFEVEGRKFVQGTFRDITESKLMQQTVKDNEEKFHTISNSVKDALILVDDNAKIVFWNPAAEKIFGYTREEALNQDLRKMVIPYSICGERRLAMKIGFEQFAKTGTGAFVDRNVELTGRRKDGSEFPIELSLSSITLGKKRHAVGVAKDITERKQNEHIAREYAGKLEKAIAERTNELKTANENLLKLERLAAIGELAGMIGHDLRNPLTGIKNAAYFIKKKGLNIPEQDFNSMLEIINKGINHSDKIINDLLDYAREMHLQLQTTSLEKLLTAALAMVKVPEKIKMVIKVPCDFEVKSDQNKIERVFINLIKNAVDAMPTGGTLTIDCKQKGGEVEISFADTGVGIPEEILPKLFSPLFTTKAQGMGFGLAICKRIIEAHEGTITVKTSRGKGTTFTIALPIEPKRNGGEKIWINMPESSLLTTTKA